MTAAEAILVLDDRIAKEQRVKRPHGTPTTLPRIDRKGTISGWEVQPRQSAARPSGLRSYRHPFPMSASTSSMALLLDAKFDLS
jgi:hypothetical protein